MTGCVLLWSKLGKLRRLFAPVASPDLQGIDTKGLQFHEDVTSGKCRLPTMTTPASDDAGRPAPKRAKVERGGCVTTGSSLHGTERAMMKDEQGNLRLAPAQGKRQLHHFRVGHTETENSASVRKGPAIFPSCASETISASMAFHACIL